MQSSSKCDYYLTKQEIESGIQVIESKVLAFFNDEKILKNNKGTPEDLRVGLFLYGVEEFGKLLLLKDLSRRSLSATSMQRKEYFLQV